MYLTISECDFWHGLPSLLILTFSFSLASAASVCALSFQLFFDVHCFSLCLCSDHFVCDLNDFLTSLWFLYALHPCISHCSLPEWRLDILLFLDNVFNKCCCCAVSHQIHAGCMFSLDYNNSFYFLLYTILCLCYSTLLCKQLLWMLFLSRLSPFPS